MLVGVAAILLLFFFWFGSVIKESPDYNLHVDKSFRMSMTWFIFSEVMFFAAFFGALYYVRQLITVKCFLTSALGACHC